MTNYAKIAIALLISVSLGLSACMSESVSSPTDEGTSTSSLEIEPAADDTLSGTFVHEGAEFTVQSTYDIENRLAHVMVRNDIGESVLSWDARLVENSDNYQQQAVQKGEAYSFHVAHALASKLNEWHLEEGSNQLHSSYKALKLVTEVAAYGEALSLSNPDTAHNCGTGNDCWYGVDSEYCSAHDECCQDGWGWCLTTCWVTGGYDALTQECTGSGDDAECT